MSLPRRIYRDDQTSRQRHERHQRVVTLATLRTDPASAASISLEHLCFCLLACDAILGRTRGLIVRQEAYGNFRRMDLAQLVFARAESVGTRTLRIGWLLSGSDDLWPCSGRSCICGVILLAYVCRALCRRRVVIALPGFSVCLVTVS